MKNKTLRAPRVVIVGAGMTGLLLFIKLREAGIQDVIILEKKDRLGGTWRDNTYPGVACDVPAHMYTYSFEPNPEWSKRFAEGSEIYAYFEKVGRKYGVIDHINFNEEVTEAKYQKGKWKIRTSQNRTLESDFLISATGILRKVNKPHINGLEAFKGDVFHTAEWRHDVDLKNKRVGVIGTGSSATQVTTTLANQGVNLHVFQRTPQWIMSFPNKEVSEKEKEACRENILLPVFYHKFQSFLIEQMGSKAVIGNKVQHTLLSMVCKFNLRKNIKDKALREKLTPDYQVGCKRLILSDGYYNAMQLKNVSLVTDGIDQLNEAGIVTKDGRQHNLDVIVMATGFDPFAYMRPMNLIGKNGIHINESWQKKIQAYRSLNLPDFPNFFLMLGPNSPIGNFSVIAISEAQTAYVVKVIQSWQQRQFDEIAAKPAAVERFNNYVRAGMGKTVWVTGCNSWYLDGDGDPAMWPYTWKQWLKEMAKPDLNDFNTVLFNDDVKSSQKSKAEILSEPQLS
jgi:cation diffusion facilitator CzcD-associated flavoprotein CzcO